MNGNILSVFLDTNIFKSCRYDFGENGVLHQMHKLFKQNRIKIYLSDVAIRETIKHIKIDLSDSYKHYKIAKKSISKLISPSLVEASDFSSIFKLPEYNELEQVAIGRFENFLDENKVIILDSKGVDIESILNDYFCGMAPFESDSKKYEFPDAIMIAKLRKEFSLARPLLIISGDEGFKKSFSGLKGFTCFSSIKDLLNLINQQDILYDEIVKYFMIEDNKKFISEYIIKELSNIDIDVNGLDCDRKGYCEGYEYDETYIREIEGFEFSLSSVDEIHENIVSVTLSCKASIVIDCKFEDYENSVWDSEEKEYIYISTGEAEELHYTNFESTIQFCFSGVDNIILFTPDYIEFDIKLDQYSRKDRKVHNNNCF